MFSRGIAPKSIFPELRYVLVIFNQSNPLYFLIFSGYDSIGCESGWGEKE
jgi:hypothetical protein